MKSPRDPSHPSRARIGWPAVGPVFNGSNVDVRVIRRSQTAVKFFTIVVALSLLTCNLAAALTDQEIGWAMQRGERAKDIGEAPAYLLVGTKSAKGDFARTFWVGVSSPPFGFFIRSCAQWIPNYVFTSTISGKAVDRELINYACLDKNQVRVLVGANDMMSAAVAGSFGYVPIPSAPVAHLRLRVDGNFIPNLPDPDNPNACAGGGSCSMLFDGELLRHAKKVEILATIGSEYVLTKTVPPKVLSDLFRK